MSQLNVNAIAPQSGSSITVSGNITATSQTGSIGRIEGDTINLSGDLTAKRYIVSSSVTELSVITNSGATAFGDSLDDTHTYTGSLQLTGSFTTSETVTSENVNSQFLTIENNRTLSKNKTFNNDDVSLVLGNNLTVDDGVSLTIEDDAQVVVVPSSFFIQ